MDEYPDWNYFTPEEQRDDAILFMAHIVSQLYRFRRRDSIPPRGVYAYLTQQVYEYITEHPAAFSISEAIALTYLLGNQHRLN